jgi:hypothetical protein
VQIRIIIPQPYSCDPMVGGDSGLILVRRMTVDRQPPGSAGLEWPQADHSAARMLPDGFARAEGLLMATVVNPDPRHRCWPANCL